MNAAKRGGYVIVFRSRLRPGVEEAYGRRVEEIYALAQQMPGLIAAKDFTAEDGERVAIVEFDTEEHLLAWRDLAEHRRAQGQGRETFYSAYSVQICKVERSSAFDLAAGIWAQHPGRW
jgi:heme-degrading monooxygenase HmoA